MSKAHQTLVKLTKKEHEKLSKDAQIHGTSRPNLLRAAYFGKVNTKVIMDRETAQNYLRELNRIGNNVNQIAKKMNSGIRFGFNNSIDNLQMRLAEMTHFFERQYGNSSS